MPFQIIRNDITQVHADAIVNTANPMPVIGGGTDSAIYEAAGPEKLLAERKKIGELRPGEAAVTPAFALHAKYIIHTVGPAWEDGRHGELDALEACYMNSLTLARRMDCKSIAFPLISTGVYRFPKDKALNIALEAISKFLNENEEEMEVILVVFDKKAFDLSSELVDDVGQYIDDKYAEWKHEQEFKYLRSNNAAIYSDSSPEGDATNVNEKRKRRGIRDLFSRRKESGKSPEPSEYTEEEPLYESAEKPDEGPYYTPDKEQHYAPDEGPYYAPEARPYYTPEAKPDEQTNIPAPPSYLTATTESLEDVIAQISENFRDKLFRIIDERGLTDSEVYKRANVDRKLFSKIRCKEDYTPGKRTAVALAIALELSLDETVDLISRAGIAFSPGSKFDLIVEYCIEHNIYDIFEINALLFKYDQPLLGA